MSTASHLAIVGALSLAWAVGHCVLLVVAGAGGPRVARYGGWSARGVSVLRPVCGVLVLAGGISLIYAAP